MRMPVNLQQWIDTHRHLLRPPVGNKCIWQDGEFICMVVGGPNQRSDYHVEEGPEFFYQLEGEMTLRLMTDAGPEDITIGPGEVYLLAPRIPHSPQRYADTVGLVIERQRLPHEQDGLQWYCERCAGKLYEEFFHLEDIETQFPPVFDRFFGSLEHRTCRRCGHVHPLPR